MEDMSNKNSVEIEELKIKCDKYEKEIEMGKLQISNLINELSHAKDSFENTEEEIRNINNSLDFIWSEFNLILNKFENINKDLAEMNVKVQKTEASNVNLKCTFDKSSESIRDIYNTIQNILNQNIGLESKVNDLKKKNEELERNVNILIKENKAIKKENRDDLLDLDSLNDTFSITKFNDNKIISNELIKSNDIFGSKNNLRFT